jgi:two-component system chemotaxis response regulator CheB
MVVDDSAVIRGLLSRALEIDPDIQVVASVGDGQMAINTVQRQDIEIVILDIEMPVMDGLTALPKLIAARPGIQVIVASTLTQRGANVSMKALSLGAADYVTKPGSSALTTADQFKRELTDKVKALAFARRHTRREAQPSPATGVVRERPGPALVPHAGRSGELRLRTQPIEKPDVVAIGSSTGGPQALFRLLKALGSIAQPMLITQHMPPTFTTILAEHIQRLTNLRAAEAVDGEAVKGGRIYIAPGDFHMVVETQAGQKKIRLTKAPPENFCRPAVDPMLRSLASAYGRKVLTVILTGMGQDGLKGGQVLVAGGGSLIAQDEKTSVVWGMPGAVAMAGLCSAVLPIDDIAPFLSRHVGRAPS